MRKWLKSPVFGALEHMHPRDALERVLASVIVLIGVLVALLIMIAQPGRSLSALAVGCSLISIGFVIRSFAIGYNK